MFCKKCIAKTLFCIAKTQNFSCFQQTILRFARIVKLRYTFYLLIRTLNPLSKAKIRTNRKGVKDAITKNRVVTLTVLFFFEKSIWVSEPLLNSWVNVSTTQMFMFTLFVSVSLLFEDLFPLWVFLKS